MTRRQAWRLGLALGVLCALVLAFWGTWPDAPTTWRLPFLGLFFGIVLGYAAVWWALEPWRR